MRPAVRVEHIAKSFGSVRAVTDVSFEVFPGEIFGLLGPNGAGKTTSIRMMLDIFRSDAGCIEILGGALDPARRDRIGYLPEERGLYKDQRLEPTLVYLAGLKGMAERVAREGLRGWLERLDLWEHRHRKIQELSRGMQQKAQLIAALLHEPDLLVVDEPFSGLDPLNTRLVKEIIEEQAKAGRAVIMSTHQMYQVEALCGRIALIDEGRTVLYGQVREIKREFSGNALSVQGEGDFAGIPGVLEVRREDDRWRLALETGADPQMVLRRMIERSVVIESFELAEPSLDDIFVAVVQEGQGARSGLAQAEGRLVAKVQDGGQPGRG
ncbi:MAG: ATP-binding cassette domain-containing protein [Thermoleophilia bacterium]|nr:ATP-binding cassette domain-containing protein [Thermoleophilia bacterium]